ncbi:minor capsid protein [Gloeothece verrucosa]|uniref:Phage head morphogenesis protein, SPP1 gp7 family n=1 Tax=Gloeothece verrucosa (strain PCC 7822) TaxID=497965 RepID=E0ULX1_GLOV7|nr:minor capsid protein [Gloeothece verrucosa]ADN17951.1 phage head morphogenesis protein, SPP1 gp7 family [Gloeothece verrucosa PCC 7822]
MSDPLSLIERYNSILSQAEDRIIERINRALAEAFVQLERELRIKYPKIQENGSLTAANRKLLLLNELKGLLDIVGNTSRYSQLFEELLKTANEQGVSLAGKFSRLMEGDDFVQATAKVPIEALKYAVEEQIRYLGKYGDEFANKASAIIEQGIIQGWHPSRIAPYLRRELGVTKVRAEMIARTASLSAFNSALKQHFLANNIRFAQFQATVDDRVCPYCSARNGNVYRIEEIRIPCHPQCRCVAMPWKADWQEQGLTNDDWHRRSHEQGIAELRATGKEPNYGLSPFEKAAGLEKPPVPIWTP